MRISFNNNLLVQVKELLESKVKENASLSTEEKEKIKDSIVILESIEKNSDEWLKACSYSYGLYHQDFLKKLSDLKNDRSFSDELFLYLICFLKEYIFSMQRDNLIYERQLIEILDKFEKDKYSINVVTGDFFPNYIKNKLLLDVLNNFLGGKDFKFFKNYQENVELAAAYEKEIRDKMEKFKSETTDKIKEFEIRISEKINIAATLEETLNEQKTAFNFVGLSKGFENLLNKRLISELSTFWFLIALGIIVIIAPVVYKISLSVDMKDWMSLLPIFGLDLIIIYFFRITLKHYHSIQAQIIQLELRQALCAFIQNYIEYAREMRDNDSRINDSLDKFENLIFSSIVSDSDKIPGTFDGLESLTSFISECRK